MRVAMLSAHTSPLATLGGKDTGGMNVYVRELSRELGRQGAHVDIFTRSQDPTAPRILTPWPRVRVIHIVAGPEAPMDRRRLLAYMPEFAAGVREFAAGGLRYEVVHSHYWLSGWVALELQRLWQVPIVQMFHTLGRMKSLVAQGEPEAAERTAIEAGVMAQADRIVAATPAEKDQMVAVYGADPSRVAVVPPGVDLSLFRPLPSETARAYVGLAGRQERLILFVGRIDPMKGLNVLFEGLCLLLRGLPAGRQQSLCLAVIGGDAEGAEALREEAICLDEVKERYGLEEMVVFLGSRSQDTLRFYYSAADVCVMPSLYESFGLVALEAMACGTPVVASRVGGLPYVVRDGETGLLVQDNDPAALAEGLRRLLIDDGLRRRLGERAAQVAQGYSWQRVAAENAKLYRQVLDQPSAMGGRLAPQPAPGT